MGLIVDGEGADAMLFRNEFVLRAPHNPAQPDVPPMHCNVRKHPVGVALST